MKQKLKRKDYKNSLGATHLENEVSHSEKNKLDVDILKANHKEFIRNNRLTTKSQQRFKSLKHNIFTKEVNEVALSANDAKRYNQLTVRNICI